MAPSTPISCTSTDVRIFSPALPVCLALTVCLVLAACGSDPSDADRVSLSYSESPIDEALGLDIALRSGDLVELERAAERGVVECMNAVGFEYVPIDFASQFEPESNAEDPDSRAYAEANGYGISIRPVFEAPAPEDLVDPNDEVRAQLSPAELDAYQIALFGEAPVDDEPVAVEDRSGCVSEAYDSMYSAQADLGTVERFFGEFGDELGRLEERFRSDPRFLELEQQWAACMAEEGFAVASREEVFVELDRRMSEVGADLVPGEEPSAEMQERIDEVRDWERIAAVAEWDCNQPVQDDMQRLRYGYEALFLEENEGRLPAGG